MQKIKKSYYIIYKYDKDTGDILNIYDFKKLKNVSKFLKIDYTNINKYILKNIDNLENEINKIKLKNDLYFIYKQTYYKRIV